MAGNFLHLTSLWTLKPSFHHPLTHSLSAYWRKLLVAYVASPYLYPNAAVRLREGCNLQVGCVLLDDVILRVSLSSERVIRPLHGRVPLLSKEGLNPIQCVLGVRRHGAARG